MEEIDLKLLIKEFWNKKILIGVIILIGILITGIYSIINKPEPTYTTTFSIISWLEPQLKEEEKNINLSLIITNLTTMINSDVMIKNIEEMNDLEIEKSKINVVNVGNGTINVSIVDSNKENAIKISDLIINVLNKEFEANENFEGVKFEILNSSKENLVESEMESDSVLLGIAISVILAFGIVFVIFLFDTKIKDENQIKEQVGLEVIDSLEKIKKINNSIENNLTTIFDFKSKNSKIFKIIVTKILNKINTVEENVLMITSTNKSEGKTYVASNIGTVLAMFGKKTVIIDTNFENSRLDKIFKVPNTLGLSNYLTGINGNGQEIKETLNNFIQETDIKNLNIITAGDVKENITNCLVSERFEEFIKQLKFYYDFIIIDSEAILNSPNSLILTEKANNTVVVVDKDGTKKEDLIKVKNDIKSVNGKIFGVVFNNTEKKNCILKMLKKITLKRVLEKQKNNK